MTMREKVTEMSRELIAFFSRADENYFGGSYRYVDVGNTEIVAGYIRDATGADMFKIEMVHPYSKVYDECIAQAKEDQRNGARPELKACPESLDGYDTIYLGYPNYWGTMPMAVFSFLERYDLDGKVIRPFCTHEGSGLGSSVSDLKRVCPGAEIGKGLAVNGSSVKGARGTVEKWVGSV